MSRYGAWLFGVLSVLEGLADGQTAPLREPIALVEVGGKWGFITRSGTYVFNRQFDGLGWFSEGLAAAKVDGKWGFMDGLGTVVIAPQFDSALGFSEGLAGVTIRAANVCAVCPCDRRPSSLDSSVAPIICDHRAGAVATCIHRS
jgi:hypothetical protein